MGLEAECTVSHQGRESFGKARLEEKDLFFKGDFRLKVPFQEIDALEVKGGDLVLEFGGQQASIRLGRPAAEKWYVKIRYPRTLLDKLGVKPEHRVSLDGVDDDTFLEQLHARAREVLLEQAPDSDLIFLQAEEVSRLENLGALRPSIQPAGAIWVLWPKGQQHIKEGDVRGAARSVGLVDVKVVSFSDRLSGLKLMIPRNQR